jgi:hypothetical protein|tara:strand:- start:82 stop:249 length:168 start_codon:yes stop_codon:yes gene_type:complete
MVDKDRITKYLPKTDLNWLTSEAERLAKKGWATLIVTQYRERGGEKVEAYALFKE